MDPLRRLTARRQAAQQAQQVQQPLSLEQYQAPYSTQVLTEKDRKREELSKIFYPTSNPAELLAQVKKAKEMFGDNPDVSAIMKEYGVSQEQLNAALPKIRGVCRILGIKI